jgi:hypothetical protein
VLELSSFTSGSTRTKKNIRMPPKAKKGKNEEKSVEGMLEGISSAHSWIKTNTMLRPTKLGKKGEGSDDSGDEEEDILIALTSKDPNTPKSSIK